MFDRLRNKFHSVQENLTSSIMGLSAGDTNNRSHNLQISLDVNINAGTDLLDYYQSCWAELHEAAQENAFKAEKVDQLIGKLHKRLQKQTRDIGQIGAMLTHLPEVIHSVCELSERVASLEVLFSSVEKALIRLEDDIERVDLELECLVPSSELSTYEENRFLMFQAFIETMGKKHSEKLDRHKLKQQRLMKERQEAFENQFKHDIQLYKETKTVPKIDRTTEKNKSHQKDENTLEDVELDLEDDENALDEFLGDTTSNLN